MTREIPFNYTSAEDHQAISLLLGPDIVETLESLRSRRVTGRSARLLARIFGEILIHRRNPFLFQELLDSKSRQERLFSKADQDLNAIETNGQGDPRVMEVLAACRGLLEEFRDEVEDTPALRKRMKAELGGLIGPKNVLVDPLALVSHATDATDWRLHLPVAVVMPDEEAQVAPLLAAIGHLGLKAIPRGGGTGLTGGAIPLRPNCVVVNTEKLNHIEPVVERSFTLADGSTASAPTVRLQAGVITERAMEVVEEKGLVFATDPTSAWASTIGGNIAENAGGKLAVRWGTCIDNLLEWRMAMPSGKQWIIRRTDHQLRKILPQDTVTFEIRDEAGNLVKNIPLKGTEIRKEGLWKDITNKALGGVPGLQKEGTDGVITSAEFLLYAEYEAQRTLCIEFFGPNMDEASRVIVEISKAFPFPDDGHETLMALEHWDDEYVRAIDYKVKAARAETPKAVLLIDVAGHTQEEAARGAQRIHTVLDKYPNTIAFEARDAAEAKKFWLDRKKLGAIARRTNAFKLNEDIVIPLAALADFAHFIERVNFEEERYTQTRFIERVTDFLGTLADREDGEALALKAPSGQALCSAARMAVEHAGETLLQEQSILTKLRHELTELMRGYPAVLEALDTIHTEVRARRVILATHMHAGDGNVHVNIPVLSNDRPMLIRADHVVDRVMEKVVALGGVVSGEHGIGVTKLKYFEPQRMAELSAYRKSVDPEGIMNPGKLEDLSVLDHIFTPSFNLMELEARILQHGQLEELAKKIAHCVRCGKCKPDCCVFHPARGMFFHPRNKNLAIGSLIEALLFEAQRERSTRFELLQWLEEIADHCTICHKCLKPCPVDIDTGEVSVLEREILASWGYKHTPLATKLTLKYLDTRSRSFNRLFRATFIRMGSLAQRIGYRVAKPFISRRPEAPDFYPLQMLRSPQSPVPRQTLRNVLPNCEPDQVLVFEPEQPARTNVVYFPGCGSERLHSEVSLAAIHLLLESGARVVLPPPFLCCGFPAHVNAKTAMHSRIVLRDTILLSQIRDMFCHLPFEACVVTCGTCKEGLEQMEVGKLFGGRVVDVSKFAMDQGLRLKGEGNYLYHPPCHDSLDGKAQAVLAKIGGFGKVHTVPHCCSEAGTLSISRPDITDAMLHRKREALEEAVHEHGTRQILTNCPSCLTGLGRNRDQGFQAKHMSIALAEAHSGSDWLEKFRVQAARAKAVSF
ncbi:MAG: linked oxidase domain protein [Holophagaceae bacterium]|nr:linked oxidase domain protein [Holophagaceae bacterium]